VRAARGGVIASNDKKARKSSPDAATARIDAYARGVEHPHVPPLTRKKLRVDDGEL
jgi:hypothetical protein